MDMLVRAYPLLDGNEDALRAFAREVSNERRQEAGAFYAHFHVARETWHVQQTPSGPWVISVSHLKDGVREAVAAEYAASDRDFDRWFKSRVRELTGIDPDEAPLGPPTEMIFDSKALEESRSAAT
jgi:hypothetical protein